MENKSLLITLGLCVFCSLVAFVFHLLDISIMVPVIFAIFCFAYFIIFLIIFIIKSVLDNKFENKIKRLGIDDELNSNNYKIVSEFKFTSKYLINGRKCINYDDIRKIKGLYLKNSPSQDYYFTEGYYVKIYLKIKRYSFYAGKTYKNFEEVLNLIKEHCHNDSIKIILPVDITNKDAREKPDEFAINNKKSKVDVKILRESQYDYDNWHEIELKSKSYYLSVYLNKKVVLKEFIKNDDAISKILKQYSEISEKNEDEKRINLLIDKKGDSIFDWISSVENDLENSKYFTSQKTKEQYKKFLKENLTKEDWITTIYVDENYNIESISYSCDFIKDVNVYCTFHINNKDYEIEDFRIEYVG